MLSKEIFERGLILNSMVDMIFSRVKYILCNVKIWRVNDVKEKKIILCKCKNMASHSGALSVDIRSKS